MRRSAWLNLSWHSRERRIPCSKSSRLFSSARSPRSSFPTISSKASSELSKLLPCGALSFISFFVAGLIYSDKLQFVAHLAQPAGLCVRSIRSQAGSLCYYDKLKFVGHQGMPISAGGFLIFFL